MKSDYNPGYRFSFKSLTAYFGHLNRGETALYVRYVTSDSTWHVLCIPHHGQTANLVFQRPPTLLREALLLTTVVASGLDEGMYLN